MSEINNSEATIPVSESQPNTPPLSESTQRDSSPSQPIPTTVPTSQPTPSPERRDNVIDMNALLRSLFQTVTNTTSRYPKIDEEDSNANNDDSNPAQEDANPPESHQSLQHTTTHRDDNSKTCCDHSRPCNDEEDEDEDEDEYEYEDEEDDDDEEDEDEDHDDEDDSQDEEDDSQEEDEEPFRADSDFRWKTLGDLVDSHNRLSQAFLQMVQKHQ